MDLSTHIASDTAKRRAEAAGIDLDALKTNDPEQYMIINSEHLVEVDANLAQEAGSAIFQAFPTHQLFQMSTQHADRISLRVFPNLSNDELERLDGVLAQHSSQPNLTRLYAFYRVVKDMRGEHRELALPVAPQDWKTRAGVMVGPFISQDNAEDWAAQNISGFGIDKLLHDVLPYHQAWFCDIFRDEQA